MKKKITVLAAVLCMVTAVCMTGCGSSAPYAKYDMSEYVKLAEYKGLERAEINVSVSDEEVDTKIEANLESAAETAEKTSGTVSDGDTVNIDYEGKLDGVVFEGGTAKGYDLEIGSGTFIDGFEDALIGKKIGGTYDLNLTFPEDYSSVELAGQNVVFTVTVNSAKTPVVPELTDEWVKENSAVETVAEYKVVIREELIEEKETSEKENIIAALWSQVVDNSEMIKYPEKEMKKYIEEIEAQYEAAAESYSMSLEELLAAYGIEDMEIYDQQNKEAAQTFIREQMVMYYIAQLEGLAYTDEEAEEMRASIKDAGYDDDSFREYYGQDIESYIDSALTFNKVADFIFDNSIVK